MWPSNPLRYEEDTKSPPKLLIFRLPCILKPLNERSTMIGILIPATSFGNPPGSRWWFSPFCSLSCFSEVLYHCPRVPVSSLSIGHHPSGGEIIEWRAYFCLPYQCCDTIALSCRRFRWSLELELIQVRKSSYGLRRHSQLSTQNLAYNGSTLEKSLICIVLS